MEDKEIKEIEEKIGEKYLSMPVNHKLVSYYRDFPLYDRALPRISKMVKEIDNHLTFIDIGANIGDTVSLITDEVDGSFLCIEGDEEYLPFLKKNTKKIKNSDFYIEESYCSDSDDEKRKFAFKRANGTTKIEILKEKELIKNISFKKLDSIIKNYPMFKKTNILKIDTDGFEIEVLKGAKNFLKNVKPIIYFEFTPDLYIKNGDDPYYIFDFLNNLGYEDIFLYDNFGFPVEVTKSKDINKIKELVSLIDNKDIYYFDILALHKSKKNNYKLIFEKELLDSISLSKKFIFLTNNELNNAKSEIVKIDNELNNANSEIVLKEKKINILKIVLINTEKKLEDNISELNKVASDLENNKLQLDIKVNELLEIYSSRGWKLVLLFRKYLYKIFPSDKLRKKVIITIFNFLKKITKLTIKVFGNSIGLFLLTKKYLLRFRTKKKRNINYNSKKLIYIGHSYHNKTKSTVFLVNYFKHFFEVEVVSDNSWEDGKPLDLSFIDNNYFGVVFFQLLPSNEVLDNIKNDNIIFFPMYDGVRQDYQFWDGLRNLKIINFSKTLHDKLKRWGMDSMYVQYFPEPREFTPGDKNKIFFWQRLTHININNITKLFEKEKIQVHLHKAIDPWQEFVEPAKKQEVDFNITYSDWFPTKEEMLKLVKESGIYISPREYEGIGMSFLEAMAMGKAVVAVNNPTMNEYIIDGLNGYLFDLKNPKKIDISNIDEIQKNAHKYICDGYQKWESEKIKIVNFIKKE